MRRSTSHHPSTEKVLINTSREIVVGGHDCFPNEQGAIAMSGERQEKGMRDSRADRSPREIVAWRFITRRNGSLDGKRKRYLRKFEGCSLHYSKRCCTRDDVRMGPQKKRKNARTPVAARTPAGDAAISGRVCASPRPHVSRQTSCC